MHHGRSQGGHHFEEIGQRTNPHNSLHASMLPRLSKKDEHGIAIEPSNGFRLRDFHKPLRQIKVPLVIVNFKIPIACLLVIYR